MKKWIIKLLQKLINLFNYKEENQRCKNRYILRMESLKYDLERTLKATEVVRQEVATKVMQASNKFEEAFAEYDELYKDYVQERASYEQVLKKKSSLEPLETVLKEANAELDKLKEFEKEEVVRITGEMNGIKRKYLKAVSETTNEKVRLIQELKQNYLLKVDELFEEYYSLTNTEALISTYMRYYGFTTSDMFIEEYSALAGDSLVTVGELSIDEEQIKSLISRKVS